MTPRKPWLRGNWAIYAGLVAAVAIVFGDLRHFDFINLDDPAYVAKNTNLAAGLTWAGVQWVFGHAYEGYWAPLVWLSYLVDHAIYGLSPGGYHTTNVILHAASSVLLFAALHRMTGARWASAAVAMLFAIHPMHVESVAWITERKATLSGLFWMLTMLAYARYVERPTAGRYALTLVAFVCGLMANAIVVTLPVILLCLDVWPLGRQVTWRRLILEKVPMVMLGIAGAAMTVFTQQQAGALASLGTQPILTRFENAVVSYGMYLLRLVWPVRLGVVYPYPPDVPTVPLIASAIALVILSALAWRARRSRPYALVGWIWFVVAIVPVSGLTQAGSQAYADRYTYLSYIGLFIAIIWLAADWIAQRPALARPIAIAGAIACAALGAVAWHQVQYWRDTETLLRQTLSVTTDNYMALNSLGVYLLDERRAEEALPILREAVRLRPGRAEGRLDYATALNAVGRFDDAEGEYRAAMQLSGDAAAASGLGTVLMKQGRAQEAAEAFTTAISRDPGYADAHFNLGKLQVALNQPAEAEQSFREAIRLSPDLVEAHAALGGLLAAENKPADALVELQEVTRLRPDDGIAHSNLGAVLVSLNRIDEAIAEFQAAVRLRPDMPELRVNLERARSLKGK
jgi:tetratricopeptide (TPR) repeat protein